MALTPSERSLVGKIGANTRWAMVEDRTAATQAARVAFDARFERLVDPDGKLSASERAKRVANARAAYFQTLALKAVQARRRRKS